MQHHPTMTGEVWSDFFITVTVIVPHVATIVLAYIGYRKSVQNNRRLRSLEREVKNGNAERGEDAPKEEKVNISK